MSLVILGRQPALGLAELESLYGASAVTKAGDDAAILDVEPGEIVFDSLGGSIKLAKVLTTLDSTEWRDIESYLVKVSPEHAAMLPEGKLTIGLSTYGLRVNPSTINATGLSIKKAIRGASDRSVRLVPNKDTEMNTAQVIHNGLTGENGWELLLVRDGAKTILAQTVAVQDIESYTVRDRERPKRDARVGMLPPKLAQIIINLAQTRLTDVIEDGVEPLITLPTEPEILLDPFCGTGVILLEAQLMGLDIYGTDLNKRMVEYSAVNLDWLKKQFTVPETFEKVEAGDATTHRWDPKPFMIACETYLGRPFTALPPPEILNQTVSECNLIIKKFLRNIGAQLAPGTRLCLAVPAWQTRPNNFKHLPLIDQLRDMGYNRISFEHVRSEDLLYYRADQVVARELLVLEKS